MRQNLNLKNQVGAVDPQISGDFSQPLEAYNMIIASPLSHPDTRDMPETFCWTTVRLSLLHSGRSEVQPVPKHSAVTKTNSGIQSVTDRKPL